MQKLFDQIREYTPISDALKQDLIKVLRVRTIKKNELLLQEGSICRHYIFINAGLVRSFYYHDGKDKTYWFYAEHQFFTSWYSFFMQEPSYETLEALEATEVGLLSYSDYQTLATQHPDFGFFARTYAELECASIDYINRRYMDVSAKEKYTQLLADIPDIASRVKLGQLASFLGISQETLSRIRAEKG
ncbi:MAG TPA: Crp/Fnr family transcriptional regulator [Cytophagales bacterium]|nr:Crp/Fnr family transcriptional regulator [Cytophagales bacterium]HAP60144.1 Crp/Fnr family transcriptional regulator [Cytophagales bacterium]